MIESSHPDAPLPEAPALSQARQVRLLVIVALTSVTLTLLFLGGGWLFAPRQAPVAPVPPGTFRPTPEQRAQLRIEPVRYGANIEVLRTSGSITADADRSTPIVLPYSGQVVKVLVEIGQSVARGQPLMLVHSTDIVDAQNALTTAQAQGGSAAQAYQVAQKNVARQRAIYETAGGALKDYLQAQNDFAAAKAQLQTAQSAVRAARDRLALFGRAAGGGSVGTAATVYRSPVAGLVADRAVSPGQFVANGNSTPLMTITDPSRVWLVAQLAESEASAVHLGDDVMVTTPAVPGRVFHATIDNIGAAIDPNTHRLPVRASIPNPDRLLKPQMFASFSIRRQVGGSGVLVPAGAVIHEGDSARVWLVRPHGLLAGRRVETGATEGGLTQIVGGLAPGDRIVTAGALFVNAAGLEQ